MLNCFCVSCQWINRWEVLYKDHLKKYPDSHTKALVNRWRKKDKKVLTCLYIIPPTSTEKELQDIAKEWAVHNL